jgi:hypothetical protein
VAAGQIVLDLQTFPLDCVAEAWPAQGRGTKAVVLV